MKGENVNKKFPWVWKQARCERRVNLHLSNLVLREKTEALLLCPALHKSLLYVDKVSATPLSPPSTGPSRPLRHVYPAARGLSGPDQLTSNYFGLFSFAGGQPGIPTERERERDDFLTNSVACEEQGPACLLNQHPVILFWHCLFLSLTAPCVTGHCIHVYITKSFFHLQPKN